MASMDAFSPPRIRGENGAAAFVSTNDPRLDLFFALVRNLPTERLHGLITACLADSRVSADEMAADLIVMAFQTRDCRGGKGEKSLFVHMFLELATHFPATMFELLTLIPKFGYYKDWCRLAVAGAEQGNTALVDQVVALMAAQLLADGRECEAARAEGGRAPEGLTLCAKWAPREGACAESNALAKLVARAMFPKAKDYRTRYRKLLSEVNGRLRTVEVLMFGHRWDEIDPSAVPSVCLLRTRKALMNEAVKGLAPTADQRETGNRHPTDEARVGLRKRIRSGLVEAGTKKLKGKVDFIFARGVQRAVARHQGGHPAGAG